MFTRTLLGCLTAGIVAGIALFEPSSFALGQEHSEPAVSAPLRLAQSGSNNSYYRYDRAAAGNGYPQGETDPDRYPDAKPSARDDAYHPPRADAWRPPPAEDRYASQSGGRYDASPPGRYGEPYERGYGDPRDDGRYPPPRRYDYDDGTYSSREILGAGHGFFGSISRGLANVVEFAFQKQGRPNGYILGEDVGGAFVAGLRYGEGWLYTRDAGRHKVFWQGPSIGYDAGAEGSKVMVLVYNMRDPHDVYHRFGGVAGSAYVVAGAGVTFQTWGNVVLAPIRSGVGLRFGANVGYLKYTRAPTWNPF